MLGAAIQTDGQICSATQEEKKLYVTVGFYRWSAVGDDKRLHLKALSAHVSQSGEEAT